MSFRVRRRTVVDVGLIGVATAAGLVLWPRLPAEMAIHFSASGTPDHFVSRTVGVVLLPGIMVATIAVLNAAARLDPPDDERVFAVVSSGTMTLLAAVHLFVLAWNLGADISPTAVAAAVLLAAFGLVAYAFVRERSLSRA